MMLDILKRPIKVGDSVVVSGYNSIRFDTVATIIKVNRLTCTVELSAHRWRRENGQWISYRELTLMRRRPTQILVIDAQLADNRSTYPETQL